MQMTLSSEGRSASGLTGALSGSGTLTLESARVAGLDPRAFEAAIRASDNGQAVDDIRLRQIVEPALSAGALAVASAQIPFNIREGRLRVGATTLDAEGARAIVSGGYDIPADQADIRVVIASTTVGAATSRPEIWLFAVGAPNALNRTVDVAALSSWLAVRAIDRETRRLDSIERGEPLPANAAPDADGLPLSDVPTSSRGPHRLPSKPRIGAPHPLLAPPNAPPVVSQQVPPLPPPTEVRPLPGPPSIVRQPKQRPPLVLMPPATTPARPAF
jgi:large subunit ribosomal protein L24